MKKGTLTKHKIVKKQTRKKLMKRLSNLGLLVKRKLSRRV